MRSAGGEPTAPLSIAVLGTDAVLRARPATAVQLAHACLESGYDAAVPASWGDELVAEACLMELPQRTTAVSVLSACPHVRARLTTAGDDLDAFLLQVAAPPVALARYLRAMHADRDLRITYVGDCPAADDPQIDARYSPSDFLAMLIARGISIVSQPTAFDSFLPPDRRRYFSLPGGVPSAEMLWLHGGRSLVHLVDEEFTTDLAQRLVAEEPALIDLAPLLGCSCSGLTSATTPLTARAAMSAVEPPRATGPVLEMPTPTDSNVPIVPQSDRQPILSPEVGMPAILSDDQFDRR